MLYMLGILASRLVLSESVRGIWMQSLVRLHDIVSVEDVVARCSCSPLQPEHVQLGAPVTRVQKLYTRIRANDKQRIVRSHCTSLSARSEIAITYSSRSFGVSIRGLYVIHSARTVAAAIACPRSEIRAQLARCAVEGVRRGLESHGSSANLHMH